MPAIPQTLQQKLEAYTARQERKAERAERGRLRRAAREANTARFLARRQAVAAARLELLATRVLLRKQASGATLDKSGRMPWPKDYFEFRPPLPGSTLGNCE